ncbi:uncharacterized protein Bfra_009787 [Botrytis fragariae]|uniref:Uncharacterized protein n=1 Tax=Botrytis fragariae TaxID=1964551 RepID=A0A8H6AMP0_9HELO|nr:uncharacterized protein Bfra_009787 [Botrytis fragariae]KAF5870401.1 hypothetical protein Bfra_009787 [Botrytis fragariae]
MTPHHNTRSQKGKNVDAGTPHLQTAQGIINKKNKARSRKGKELDTNTSEPAQDNKDATEKLQTQKVFEPIHQLLFDLENLQQGVAAAAVKVLGIDGAKSCIGDLLEIEGTADACGTPLHAIINRIQQGIDKFQSAIDKAKFIIVGNQSDDCEEDGEEGFEDGYTSDGSAGSDILAVPESLQQPPHKQVYQSQASVVEPSAATDVAYPPIPRKTAELSAKRIDVNRRPSAKVALDNIATSSGAGTLRRSKRIRDTARNQEREDKRQRRS